MNMMNKFRIFRKWAGGVSLSFLFLSTGLAPVYASDTEVYARSVDFSGEVTPVLMMVLDSSGSMLFCMDGTGPCPYPNIKRIEALQNAMKKVLYGSPTGTVVKPAPDFIKMGYARFNPDANDGGWMRYPALKLGEYVTTAASAVATVEARVLAGEDDAVAGSPANISGTSYNLGSDVVGVRFADLQIPQNATISGATLTFFRPNSTGAVPSKLLVKREHSADAAPYSALNGPDALTRNYGSGLQLDTETPPNNSWIEGTVALDVSAQVQNQVNLSDWCGGQALAFRIENTPSGTNSFAASSFEDTTRTVTVDTVTKKAVETDVRPRLIVTYTITGADRTGSCISAPIDVVKGLSSTFDDIEWSEASDASVFYRETKLEPGVVPNGVRNQVALRFSKLPLPNGVAIDKAWLYVTQVQSDPSVAATVKVSAYDADNVTEFCTQDATTKVVTCTAPAASLSSAASLALPASATDGTHLAVDVTAQVQAVVARAGWAANNAIAFRLVNNSNDVADSSNTALYSVDAGLSKAAILHVVMRPTFKNIDNLKKTARQDLYDDIKVRMYAEGGTPLGDAYAEAARYLLGMTSYSRDTFTTTFSDQTPSQTYRQPDSRTTVAALSNDYLSPLVETGQCSANYIFMMSDGDPNNASNVNNNSGGITGGYNADCNAYNNLPVSSGNSKANFACMASVATHLASANNQKKALIRTNTVLFDNDASTSSNVVKDMKMVAEAAGKGTFFHAKNENQLTDSLLKTMSTLLDETGSITAPGVAVNQFNRLTHLDQLYYAVFDPDTGKSRWRGNVKRYKLAFSATGASIVDKLGNPAIDTGTTFFSTESHSFWSPLKDGNTAVLGGVASVLPRPDGTASRTIYTYMPAYTSNMSLTPLSGVATATGRAAVTGLTVDAQFTNLRNWLYGYAIDLIDTTVTPKIIKKTALTVNTSTQVRNELGGVLHSQPVLVNYGYTSSTAAEAQTDPTKQDNTLFFSTMEGMLHAVKAGGDPLVASQNGGRELFAFMPKETLARAAIFALSDVQAQPEFGLDMTWTVHRVDGNADLRITGSGGSADTDKVWLYGGMRMGGSNYYAMNVTDRSAPKLKWVIEGGTGSGNFGGMGQTWSKPVIGQIKVNNVLKTVLFFGGGYDDKHETAGYGAANTSDAKGNQVYIVDADTGSMLWSASATGTPTMTVSEMKFSVPSELKLFDANKDGLVDAVYFGDLGGQVFRLDIDNATTSNAGIGSRVRRIANLGQLVTNNVANQRRFYEAPGVAMMYDAVREAPYVAVAMGSGYRSHPLDLQTEDRFYVLRDNDVLRSDLLSTSDLQDPITPTDLATVDLSSPAGATMTEKMGWMIDLPTDGEKVLASPLILFGEVFFTTYIPVPDSVTDPTKKCKPVIGASSLWRVSATDGAATFDFNKDAIITAAERNKGGIVQGLGGAPQLLIGEDGKNAVITGTGVERNKDLQSPTMRRTRWFEKTK